MRAALLAIALAPAVALAEDPPCKADGDRVVCARTGFDVLVRRVIDADAAAKEAGIRLAAADQSVVDLKAALDACLARPIPKPPPPPSAWSQALPVVTGVVGAALLTASVTADWSLSGRAAGAVVGSALVGAGILFSLP